MSKANPTAKIMFENLVMAFDDEIRVSTAQALADDLGIEFDPLDYEH